MRGSITVRKTSVSFASAIVANCGYTNMAAKAIFASEQNQPQPRNTGVANRVIVKNLSPTTSEETIIIHFQRRKNGGGEVDSVRLLSEGVAVVTFEKPEGR